MPTDLSSKTASFTESVIREQTRRALKLGAVDLAQGFPDFPAPAELKEAAKQAIDEDYNQYPITHGSPNLRRAIAEKVRSYNRIECDPDRNLTVVCGATEAMIASLLAITNPGDEMVVFEPYYENYGPDTIIAGASRRVVSLRGADFTIDPAELEAAFGPRTKAIIVNTPHNPTGKVFTMAELEMIAELCRRFDTLVITDEIYEHIIYGSARHISIASLPGMAERTITISGLSKTYSVTGWRLAYTVACERLTSAIRKIHDFLTVGAPHPLQQAGVTALRLPESFYAELVSMYERRRMALYKMLTSAGFECKLPDGAYYIMADVGRLGFANDFEACNFLLEQVGVASVPGSSFYQNKELGRRLLRFTFSKKDETLAAAGERFKQLEAKLASLRR
jgi:aspartate/methionine/tyrosine aminotransferase